ncbi:hypothetical protein N0V93_007258 [Gnomoniopsis smithogilvyi]|uniref:Uncharacterized protein n=1 Tax=Gnomoniopsis smithogilvyi TaxID=1191159 RepID=A0A9W8YSD0_9PEZI|nr:hypothetical protein N0V93_007258 [Gnomoniopsis smithogilvyi]
MSSTSRVPSSSRPISVTAQGRTNLTAPKTRGRSRSFASALKRLLPTNRPERGGTRRSPGAACSGLFDSSPVPVSQSMPCAISKSGSGLSPDRLIRWNTAVELASQPNGHTSITSSSTRSQQLYLEHRERRRRRQSLKESGDYLGVQGINPSTGEMDVITPSTSTASSPFVSLVHTVQDKRLAYENARKALRAEKLRKWEMDKEALKAERRRKVRWTRRGEQWSSAVEPDLSPITGSSGGSTPRKAEVSTETMVRAPSERFFGETETVDDSVSTVRPATKATALSAIAGYDIQRKPVPIRSSTLSSRRSHSDLIPVDSEVPEPPPKPPKAVVRPVG